MGEVADAKFSYRLVGAYQDGNAYFKNVDDKRKVFHPTVQVDFKNTTFRAAFDYIDLTTSQAPKISSAEWHALHGRRT